MTPNINAHPPRCCCEECFKAERLFPKESQASPESPDSVITLTRAELQEERDAAFRMGVKAGMEKRDLRPIEAGKALRG